MIIRKSFSPYASLIVVVLRKDGRIRLYCDFRELNEITIRDSWPLPNITASLANLAHQSMFSSLDCKDAYHNIEMAEESIQKTAMCTPFGLYEWLRVPYGLKNASQFFARVIYNALCHLSEDVVVPFQDDALVVGRDFHHHLKNLDKVLQAYEDSGFILQIKNVEVSKNQWTILDLGSQRMG